MPDKNKETKEKNYIKQYVGESGYTYDATKIRNQLAKEAYQRYIEQDDEELQKEAEENYIMAIYPNEKDEYLVEGAVLTCTMTTRDKKHYKDKVYKVDSPCQTTTLSVTKNKNFKCCDLPHATIKDTKKSDDENHNNISPFRCNCMLAPYTDEEWEALEADETCLTEGTCRALMKLNKEWDNLPRVDGDECQKINGIPSINMGSILFCRHGGIITAALSGQESIVYTAGQEIDRYLYNKKMICKIETIHPWCEEIIKQFKDAYEKNQSRYMNLAKQMDIPPELLAMIHYRENSPDYMEGKFNVYLHNGETLGKLTTKKPENLLFYDFDEAALDAIARKRDELHKFGITYETRDFAAMLCFLETYNGKGYYGKGVVNPYLYSGTNIYVSGKYVSDGNYVPEAVDDQVGCYVFLNALFEEE